METANPLLPNPIIVSSRPSFIYDASEPQLETLFQSRRWYRKKMAPVSSPSTSSNPSQVLTYILNSMSPSTFVSRLRTTLDPAMGYTSEDIQYFLDGLSAIGFDRAIERAEKVVANEKQEELHCARCHKLYLECDNGIQACVLKHTQTLTSSTFFARQLQLPSRCGGCDYIPSTSAPVESLCSPTRHTTNLKDVGKSTLIKSCEANGCFQRQKLFGTTLDRGVEDKGKGVKSEKKADASLQFSFGGKMSAPGGIFGSTPSSSSLDSTPCSAPTNSAPTTSGTSAIPPPAASSPSSTPNLGQSRSSKAVHASIQEIAPPLPLPSASHSSQPVSSASWTTLLATSLSLVSQPSLNSTSLGSTAQAVSSGEVGRSNAGKVIVRKDGKKAVYGSDGKKYIVHLPPSVSQSRSTSASSDIEEL
ncbi:hypothetical protein NMY22_g9539 [Coprinellus aureogranulatus]|nr:hypothetical protein NMY22_g9539 [Coprinellus aureogranulatus]